MHKLSKDENDKVKIGLSLLQVIHMMKEIPRYTEQGNGFNTHFEIYNHIFEYLKQFTVELMILGIDVHAINDRIRNQARKTVMKHEVEEMAEMFIEYMMKKENTKEGGH